jgi:hypothetical protein
MSMAEKSIKMNKIMRNEPNFQKSQMFITVISTMNYNEKLAMDTWSKQTQTKPILRGTPAQFRGLPTEGRQQGAKYFFLTKSGGKCKSRYRNQQGWVISLFPLPPLPALFFLVFLATDKHGLTQIKKQLQLNFRICPFVFVKISFCLKCVSICGNKSPHYESPN